jgi:hypothetical protein
LIPLAGRLPPEWQERYESLSGEFGSLPGGRSPRFESTWVGPLSPWTREAVAGWAPAQLIERLRAWEPRSGWREPTPEGAGRLVAEVVATNPGRYAAEAFSFRELEPTYVRALLGGLREAVREERPFSWAPVLVLGDWITRQSDPPREGSDPERDQDWSATRKELASLLSAGLEAKWAVPDLRLRTTVWNVLTSLTEDKDPTPTSERRYGADELDPLTVSINTTRGEALHAVVRYALWNLQAHEGVPDWRAFDEMPEVRELLERHLHVETDSSLAIRAVYGQWLPWLVLLDRRWVEDHLEMIFPSALADRNYRDAAWDTYLARNQLFRSVFEVVAREYDRAVDEVGRERALKTFRHEHPDELLAEHVLTAYLLGWIELEPDQLAARLFSRAPGPIRVHALTFVGSVLGEEEGPTPTICERAQDLWAWHVANGPTPAEYATFGHWYESGRLEEEWALPKLLEALAGCEGPIDSDHGVAERLAASTAPLKDRLRAFDLMVQGAPANSWRISSWETELRAVLSPALADPATHLMGRDLIGRLLAKGYDGFIDLRGE